MSQALTIELRNTLFIFLEPFCVHSESPGRIESKKNSNLAITRLSPIVNNFVSSSYLVILVILEGEMCFRDVTGKANLPFD